MTKRLTAFIVAMLLTALLAPAVTAKTAAELLREGLYAEEVEGNLDSAISIYQQVVSDASAPRNLVAQALYRQGMCLVKKKQDQEAQAAFRRIVADYSDQTEIVEKVRPLLEELGNADPASLMPPETFVYVEIGSPGAQVETVLNMLKGTPMENPLAAINAGGDQAQMLGAFLNPGTLAEFKKIRGLGIGVMDVAKDGPPSAIVVLFPGKSDALRGLLMMVVSMVGKPAEAIEGMTTVTFQGGGGAAYDDTVVIIATPSAKAKDLLQWSVRRYKGKSHEASLASSNKSFMKIGKQARQQNALTVWMNAGDSYERLNVVIDPKNLPEPFRNAGGLANLKDMSDVLLTLSLRETGIALEGNVAFKSGSKFQTSPSLNKSALKAVPADAVALISVTLSGPGSTQAQFLGERIKAATGLDLGSQIFGNIEQITLFAVPPKDTALANPPVGIPLALQSFGLAVSCKDPQQVQQLLMKVLQSAKAIAAPAEGQAAPQTPASGNFEFTLTNGPKCFGYTDPANHTFLLSLAPQLIESSLTAMKQGPSAASGGKLQEALATLSPNTSSLVLINVAGAIQLASQNIRLGSDEATQQARDAMAELIKACQKTTLRLQTNEEPNNLNIRLSVSDLPPLNQVFGPIHQIAQLIQQATGGGGGQWSESRTCLTVAPAAKPPTIDGNPDDAWSAAESHAIEHVVYNPASSPEDLSAGFKALWDDKALYVLVDVTDDKLVNDSEEYYQDDAVEVFIDADYCRAGQYGEKDYRYHFDWDAKTPALGEAQHDKTTGVQYVLVKTDKGYRVEAAFPWSTLGATPGPGAKVGLDVHVNDDDDNGDRDTKLMWCATEDVSWENLKALGAAELAGLIGWWKLDEAQGDTAADSSGNGHRATVHGNPAWQPTGGKVGGAMQFDGDVDHLEVADKAAFDIGGGVTVAAWIKVNAFNKPYQAIVTKGDSAWRIQRNNETNTLEFACSGLKISGDNQYGSLLGAKEITSGQWHHVAGVYDGKKMYLYVDGALDASQEASGSISSNDLPVLIGENAEREDRGFNGSIDDVRVYNFGLPESQVQQLYQGK